MRHSSLQWGKWIPLAGISLLTIVGAALRAYHLGFKPLWFDEAVVYWIANHPIPDLVVHNSLENSAPPLFALLVSIVSRISDEEWILRAIPCLAGTLVIPAFYILACRFFSQGASLTAAFLVTIAPSQIEYSQQLREYSLSVLASVVLLAFFIKFLDDHSVKYILAMTLAVVVSIFLQYGLALLILSLNVVFLVALQASRRGWDPEILLNWILIQVAGLLSALVVYMLALRNQIEPGGFASAGHLASAYWTGSSLGSALEFSLSGVGKLTFFTFPGYGFMLLVVLGLLVLLVGHGRPILATLVTTVTVVVAAAALLRLYPLSGGRQDMFLAPLLFLLAGAAFDVLLRLDRRLLLVVPLLALVAASAVHTLNGYYADRGPGAYGLLISEIADSEDEDLPIYICSVDPVLRYYVEARALVPSNPIVDGSQSPGSKEDVEEVDALLRQHGKAWLLTHSGCGETTPVIFHYLSSPSIDVELVEEQYPRARLYLVH